MGASAPARLDSDGTRPLCVTSRESDACLEHADAKQVSPPIRVVSRCDDERVAEDTRRVVDVAVDDVSLAEVEDCERLELAVIRRTSTLERLVIAFACARRARRCRDRPRR